MKQPCATCGTPVEFLHRPTKKWWRCEGCTEKENGIVRARCAGMTFELIEDSWINGPARWLVTHTDGRTEVCVGVEGWGANAGHRPGIHPAYRIRHPRGGEACLNPLGQLELL